jgi:hypothetical protein
LLKGINGFSINGNAIFSLSTMGTSESFMHHPENDRCVPKVANNCLTTNDCLGAIAASDLVLDQ